MVDVSQTVAASGTAGSLETVACCCSSSGTAGEVGTAVAFETVVAAAFGTAAAAFENLEKQTY